MDEHVERQAAYRRSFVLAREIFSAGKIWPPAQKGLYTELRRAAADLPSLVAASLLRENAQAVTQGLHKALETACRSEILLQIAVEKDGRTAQGLSKLHALADEALEAIRNHIAAMGLS